MLKRKGKWFVTGFGVGLDLGARHSSPDFERYVTPKTNSSEIVSKAVVYQKIAARHEQGLRFSLVSLNQCTVSQAYPSRRLCAPPQGANFRELSTPSI
jgi:hypothetical protein